MEAIDKLLQNSELAITSRPLPKRLSDAEAMELGVLLGQMVQRYPGQDLSESMEGFLLDYEALAVKYTLEKVRDALGEMRIKPGQSFFPRPDEVAEMIERKREAGLHEAALREGEKRKKQDEHDFWAWVDEQVELSGQTEQQVLDGIKTPGYTGRKARGDMRGKDTQ
jgi:hypothetical protein